MLACSFDNPLQIVEVSLCQIRDSRAGKRLPKVVGWRIGEPECCFHSPFRWGFDVIHLRAPIREFNLPTSPSEPIANNKARGVLRASRFNFRQIRTREMTDSTGSRSRSDPSFFEDGVAEVGHVFEQRIPLHFLLNWSVPVVESGFSGTQVLQHEGDRAAERNKVVQPGDAALRWASE